jgi:hypothetical protein
MKTNKVIILYRKIVKNANFFYKKLLKKIILDLMGNKNETSWNYKKNIIKIY